MILQISALSRSSILIAHTLLGDLYYLFKVILAIKKIYRLLSHYARDCQHEKRALSLKASHHVTKARRTKA